MDPPLRTPSLAPCARGALSGPSCRAVEALPYLRLLAALGHPGVPIGHCTRCGHLLHDGALLSAPDEAVLDLPDRLALWRSVALSRVLAWTSALEPGFVVRPEVMVGRFSRLLAHALERPPVSWIDSRRDLGNALGIEAKDICRLVSGERGPSLVALVDSCMQLGVDPVRLVRGDLHGEDRSWPPEEASGLLPCGDTWRLPVEVRERRSSSRYPERARALDEFIADSEAVDLGRVQRHGGTHATLASAFPLRYARAAELRAERVARARQRNSQRLNAALDREIASGAPRSIREVAASLGVSSESLHYYSPERSAGLLRGVNRYTLLVSRGFVIGFMPVLSLLFRCRTDPLSMESRGRLASRISWLGPSVEKSVACFLTSGLGSARTGLSGTRPRCAKISPVLARTEFTGLRTGLAFVQ